MAGDSLEVGPGLVVKRVVIAQVKEQDLNAQVMQPREFERLTENIRMRGALEQLPYCYQPDGEGVIEVVSGHHRLRAARQAGLSEVWVLVDTMPMRRTEVTAKAIAHNIIHGTPDENVLRELVATIDNVDDLLTTGLPEEFLPLVDDDNTQLQIPHADFDWRIVYLSFLPGQMADFQAAVEQIERQAEFVGVAQLDQFEEFAKACYTYGRLMNVKSISTTVAMLTELAVKAIDEMQADGVQELDGWVRIAHLVGPSMPPDAAKIVRDALGLMEARGDLDPAKLWRALELWAADYLASP